MNCVHFGKQVGDYVRVCCNGAERRSPIHDCHSSQQPATFCSLETLAKGMATIEIAGERRIVTLASCRVCPYRE